MIVTLDLVTSILAISSIGNLDRLKKLKDTILR
ncbi:hypothetical protein SAM_1352, partial [Streptococcus agalactiae CJB111]